MRLFVAVLIGIAGTLAWLQPWEVKEELPIDPRKVGIADSAAFMMKQKAYPHPGALPGEWLHIFHDAIPDYMRCMDNEPDSGNTSFYFLSVWPDEKVLLIETMDDCFRNACPYSIYVCAFDPDTGWGVITHFSGMVDTILPAAHNGLHDFTITNQFLDDMQFTYNGNEFVEVKDKGWLNDTQQVQHFLADYYYPGDNDYSIGLDFRYLQLDSGSAPFVVASHMICDQFVFKETSPGKLEQVGYFPDAAMIDILNTTHYGVSDIRATGCYGQIVFYKWNGKEYVAYKWEAWQGQV